jgi:hypothetical protein
MRSMRLFWYCLMIGSIASCVSRDDCAWSKRIVVSESDQLARATKEQIVAHNRKASADRSWL